MKTKNLSRAERSAMRKSLGKQEEAWIAQINKIHQRGVLPPSEKLKALEQAEYCRAKLKKVQEKLAALRTCTRAQVLGGWGYRHHSALEHIDREG